MIWSGGESRMTRASDETMACVDEILHRMSTEFGIPVSSIWRWYHFVDHAVLVLGGIPYVCESTTNQLRGASGRVSSIGSGKSEGDCEISVERKV